MSLTQLFHLIESLPPALQARVEVFMKSLREAQSSEANSGQPQPTIRWAADPNPAALPRTVPCTYEQSDVRLGGDDIVRYDLDHRCPQ